MSRDGHDDSTHSEHFPYITLPLWKWNLGQELLINDEVELHHFTSHIQYIISDEAVEDVSVRLHRHHLSETICRSLNVVYVVVPCQSLSEVGAGIIELGNLLLWIGQMLRHEAIPLAHHYHMAFICGNNIYCGI